MEHVRFLDFYGQSGLSSKAAFTKARMFNEAFRVVKTDRGALEYMVKLTTSRAQFCAVEMNYSQVVKELHAHFSEERTLTSLYKLERATRELTAVGQQVVPLSEEFKQRWQSISPLEKTCTACWCTIRRKSTGAMGKYYWPMS